MKRAFLTAAALLLTGLTSQPVHAALAPFKADYSVRYHGIPASAQANLQRQGNNWLYLMSVGNAAASMNQATVFMERGDFYIPLGGSDRVQYPGGGPRGDHALGLAGPAGPLDGRCEAHPGGTG